MQDEAVSNVPAVLQYLVAPNDEHVSVIKKTISRCIRDIYDCANIRRDARFKGVLFVLR